MTPDRPEKDPDTQRLFAEISTRMAQRYPSQSSAQTDDVDRITQQSSEEVGEQVSAETLLAEEERQRREKTRLRVESLEKIDPHELRESINTAELELRSLSISDELNTRKMKKIRRELDEIIASIIFHPEEVNLTKLKTIIRETDAKLQNLQTSLFQASQKLRDARSNRKKERRLVIDHVREQIYNIRQRYLTPHLGERRERRTDHGRRISARAVQAKVREMQEQSGR